MRRFAYIIILVSLLFLCAESFGIERFPPPDFVETNHKLPEATTPAPREAFYEYLDIFVLLSGLILASYLVLKKRSRKLIFCLMIFSLIYFGFWRKGCVCSIGSIQNVVLSIFDSSYAIPIGALVFFILPLIFTLFFGRVFCAALCPLGAIQDIVLLRSISVPAWLESCLRILAYTYLAAVVLFAGTSSAFIICRYDPFISFFRLSGSLNIVILGICFLIVGIFIGRPYCRFFCPYGIILRQLSRISKWKVTITPDECIKCKLCEDSCPFGAIKEPTAQWIDSDYKKGKKRLVFLIILLPILIGLGASGGNLMSPAASKVHETVRLAERIYAEDTEMVKDTTDASTAFRATGQETKELYEQADLIKDKFAAGGWLFGGFIGFVIGLKLISHSIRRVRDDYQAERAGCLACGRCFEYCPRDKERLKKLTECK